MDRHFSWRWRHIFLLAFILYYSLSLFSTYVVLSLQLTARHVAMSFFYYNTVPETVYALHTVYACCQVLIVAKDERTASQVRKISILILLGNGVVDLI
jgi:hypothetical protein